MIWSMRCGQASVEGDVLIAVKKSVGKGVVKSVGKSVGKIRVFARSSMSGFAANFG